MNFCSHWAQNFILLYVVNIAVKTPYQEFEYSDYLLLFEK